MPQRSTLAFAALPATFWIALVLLVLNDHVLKGSGLVPSVITGKLSDFAGLIVAPIMLCAAFAVRTDRARGVLFGAVALGFAAIKLSPELASGAAAALTMLGVPSRIWCDPTDLVAFAVLPWAARIAQRVEPMRLRGSRRFAVGIAALACVATSDDSLLGEIELRGPFVINWTHGELDVSIVHRWTVCGEPESALSEAIEERLTLHPAHMKELGWDAVARDSGVEGCGLAIVRAGDATARVTWDPAVSAPIVRELEGGFRSDAAARAIWGITHADEWAFERGITVFGSAQAAAFEIGELLNEEDAP